MTGSNNNFSDLCKIIGEINHFIGLTNARKFNEIDRLDHLHFLPHPNGMGHLILGREGVRLFSRLTRRAVQNDEFLRFRASTQTVGEAIKWQFSHQILKPKKKLTPALADRIIGRACKHVRTKKLETKTHFLPCVLAQESGRDEFWIGPVRFQTTELFFSENEQRLTDFTQSVETRYTENEKSILLGEHSRLLPPKDGSWPKIEIKESAQFFENSLREYLSTYRWIASTKLEGFDNHMGDRITRLSIETALNILRLFIGAYHADHFRIGGDFRIEKKEVRVAVKENDRISISVSSRSEEATLGNGWLNILFSGDSSEQWLRTAGSLIPYIQAGKDLPLLYQRLIDALWWYGEAVSEPLPNAKVTRYANALEVFLGTSSMDIAHQISVRIAYLCADDVVSDSAEWFDKAKRFYDARSRLVHGRLSPMHPDIDDFVSLGERITSKTLKAGLDWTLRLSLINHQMNEREIEQRFREDLPLCSHGLIFGE